MINNNHVASFKTIGGTRLLCHMLQIIPQNGTAVHYWARSQTGLMKIKCKPEINQQELLSSTNGLIRFLGFRQTQITACNESFSGILWYCY